MNDEPRPPRPVVQYETSGLGGAAIFIGWLLLVPSSLCTGLIGFSFLTHPGGGYLVTPASVLMIGAPFILSGLGLIALGRRTRERTPGPPPLWHRVVGGLLVVAALGLAGLWLDAAVRYARHTDRISGDGFVVALLGEVGKGLLPLGLMVGMVVLGLALVRPRR